MNEVQKTPSFNAQITALAQFHLGRLFGAEEGKKRAAGIALMFDAMQRVNPQIAECTADSIAYAVAMSIFTGLQAGGPWPDCYLIPRGNRRQVDGKWKTVNELTWMISWRGMVTLARRSGYGIRAVCVHQGDRLEHGGGYLDLLDPRPPRLFAGDVTADRTWDNLGGVVVVAADIATKELVGWCWVSKAEILARRNVSDGYKRGVDPMTTEWSNGSKISRKKTDEEVARGQAAPWFQWPLEMAQKTAIRFALSRALVPIDVAMSAAAEADDASDRYVVEPIEPKQIAAPVESEGERLARELANATKQQPDPVPAERSSAPDPDEQAAIAQQEAEQARRDAEARKAPPVDEEQV